MTDDFDAERYIQGTALMVFLYDLWWGGGEWPFFHDRGDGAGMVKVEGGVQAYLDEVMADAVREFWAEYNR